MDIKHTSMGYGGKRIESKILKLGEGIDKLEVIMGQDQYLSLMKILSNSNKSSLIGERFHLSDFKGSNVSTESWDYGLLKLSYISKNLN
ncbi:hypothetical protein HOK68_03470 [Candidatus Woesearchaeota archaeon]|jgi:hypothetical protein|nr:hypothetical protein [Candidatus Woesearchaeota archaeon]MBT4387404.1 hypothetical protein [Candidatus Woesearchaeota archaeon]MBT4595781.1 hypothetical protein [Candidatus Woesearchaeota archaeon]MBT5741370.1 hypothetical protein [Candidatus Woesearchaeota archaeon]MBT6505813.1 hypothetical protein [Candidatus Woesearchaeota archaeon]